MPATVTRTQVFTLLYTVSNSGGVTAQATAPQTMLTSGSGSALLQTGPIPANAPVPGAGSAVFTYTYSASGSGSVVFSDVAIGTDPFSGASVTSTPGVGAVLVQEPLALSISSLQMLPSSVGTGSTFTVLMTVANGPNSAAAQSLSADASLVAVNGGGSITSLGAPSPVSVASLAGGGSTVFTYLYTANTPAPLVSFYGEATGRDANQANVLATSAGVTSAAGTIYAASHLNAQSVVVLPGTTVSTGQLFTVEFTVQNNGQGNADTVTAAALQPFGTGGAVFDSLQPLTGTSPILVGNSQVFTFVYTATSPGAGLGFSAMAQGFDDAHTPLQSAVIATTPFSIVAAASVTNLALTL
ncbi:MAG TPA: hypothetical protein VNZ67_12820, partial [bacterium]|nr:hypothetical protein [bacterium]